MRHPWLPVKKKETGLLAILVSKKHPRKVPLWNRDRRLTERPRAPACGGGPYASGFRQQEDAFLADRQAFALERDKHFGNLEIVFRDAGAHRRIKRLSSGDRIAIERKPAQEPVCERRLDARNSLARADKPPGRNGGFASGHASPNEQGSPHCSGFPRPVN